MQRVRQIVTATADLASAVGQRAGAFAKDFHLPVRCGRGGIAPVSARGGADPSDRVCVCVHMADSE